MSENRSRVKKCFIKRQNRGASEYETKSDRTKSFESLMIRIEKKKNQCVQHQAASETTKAEEKRHQCPNKTP